MTGTARLVFREASNSPLWLKRIESPVQFVRVNSFRLESEVDVDADAAIVQRTYIVKIEAEKPREVTLPAMVNLRLIPLRKLAPLYEEPFLHVVLTSTDQVRLIPNHLVLDPSDFQTEQTVEQSVAVVSKREPIEVNVAHEITGAKFHFRTLPSQPIGLRHRIDITFDESFTVARTNKITFAIRNSTEKLDELTLRILAHQSPQESIQSTE